MRHRKITGIITVTAAIPNIGFMFLFIFLYHASFVHWMVIEKFLIGITCILGGFLLCRGDIWGYRFSIIGWILILWSSISSLYVAIFHTTNANLQSVMFIKDIIFSLFSSTILFILFSDMIRLRKI